MKAKRKKVKRALRKVCSRHLWRAVPGWLETRIIEVAIEQISKEDINASPYGQLYELAVQMTTEMQGYGIFETFADEEVVIKPSKRYGIFYGCEPNETYVKID